MFTKNGMVLMLFIAAFLLIFVAKTTDEIEMVEKGGNIGTTIITSDSTYRSTDSAYYIGQTSNYVFFYNGKDKHTTVLPAKEIKRIELHIE